MRLAMLAAFLGTSALIPLSAQAQQPNQPSPVPQPSINQQGQAGQQQFGQQPNQPRQAQQGLAASQLQDQTIYTQGGQQVGSVDRLVQDRNNRTFAVITSGNQQALVPTNRLAYRNNRFTVTGADDQLRFQAYNQQVAGQYRDVDPTYRLAIVGYEVEPVFGLRRAEQQQTAQRQVEQDGSRIVVRQPAPTVQVDPADPRVMVRQQPPRVTVNQAQPEILVRQPQPTVTVNIPQPEIIVRMPEPDVNVAMAQPQVQVQQPRPEVRVQQPEQQAQVQVERAQPQVMVQQAEREAQVQFQQQGQPQVRYERAEPRVVVNQAEGQPQVRFERQGEPNVQVRQQQMAAAGSVYTDEQRRSAWERLRAGDVDTTGAIDANAQLRPLPVANLEDMDVYNARGDELGEVDRVIVTPQGREFVIVAAGGFLGLGEDTVAFPLERFWLRGDELVIRGVTEEDIEAMDDYRDSIDNYQRLSRTDRTDLRVWQ